MCEYCGCQELPAIAELTAEHDVVVNLSGLARRALAAGDLESAAYWTRQVAAVLVPHTAVEEGALFPAMAREFDQHVRGLLDEHRQVEAVLAESADHTPSDPGWPHRLDTVLHLLREHILKEQDGVFPAALATLDPGDWDLVDEVRSRVGSAVRQGADAAAGG